MTKETSRTVPITPELLGLKAFAAGTIFKVRWLADGTWEMAEDKEPLTWIKIPDANLGRPSE